MHRDLPAALPTAHALLLAVLVHGLALGGALKLGAFAPRDVPDALPPSAGARPFLLAWDPRAEDAEPLEPVERSAPPAGDEAARERRAEASRAAGRTAELQPPDAIPLEPAAREPELADGWPAEPPRAPDPPLDRPGVVWAVRAAADDAGSRAGEQPAAAQTAGERRAGVEPLPAPAPAARARPDAAPGPGSAEPTAGAAEGVLSGEPAGAAASAAVEAPVPAEENAPPRYPRLARRLGEEGTVVLAVDVAADGAVLGVEVSHSSGYARLDEAARDAVRLWTFHPARRDGVAVRHRAEIQVRFQLTD